ncbi:hypothetical protein H8D36_04810 [archaeon]|nr:hypothetical protein [archaeon]MBL7057455.1 hypothetical protein [Candidatus Woesearchaeota archaeon]
MAKEKVDYTKLKTHADFLKHASESVSIKDLEDRVDTGHAILYAYQENPHIDTMYRERQSGVNISDIEKKILKERKVKGKIDSTKQMDFFKEMATEIAPKMLSYKSDSPDENYHNLVTYLNEFDSMQKDGKRGQSFNTVLELIKEGNVQGAFSFIADAIIKVKKSYGEIEIQEAIVPRDEEEFHDKAASVLADRINIEYGRLNINKKAKKSEISRDIRGAYKERVSLAKMYLDKYGSETN